MVSKSSKHNCPVTSAVWATLEGLEERRLLANDPLVTATLKVGTANWLNITGSNNADEIVVQKTASTTYRITNGTWMRTVTGTFAGVKISAGNGDDNVTITGALLFSSQIVGGVGNDTLNGAGMNDSIWGSDGDDVIVGNSGADSLMGENGNDDLQGLAGADWLSGGNGNDSLDGGADADKLNVDAGADVLIGGLGYDTMSYSDRTVGMTISYDGIANDGMTGEFDNLNDDIEVLWGGKGNDNITGNANANRIEGMAGNDTIDALAGDDYLLGGDGNDSMFGRDGKDSLYGNNGDDKVYAGAGDDFVDGNAGNDRLEGGHDRDTLMAIGGGVYDILVGGEGLDSFWLDNNLSEVMTDVSAEETAARATHRVTSFVSQGKTAVSKEITGTALADPVGSGTLRNFKNNKLFASAGPSENDIIQGQTGDCWFLSTLSSIAGTNPEFIRQMITSLGDGTFAVRFKSTTGVDQYVRVDADIRTYSWSTTIAYYANFGAEQSMWVPLVEKAFTYVRGSALGNYSTISGGWMSEAAQRLGITQTTYSKFTNNTADSLVARVEADLAAGKSMTIGMLGVPAGANLVGNHAYMIDSIVTNEDGTKTITLRNPWGVDNNTSTDGANDGYVSLNSAQFFAAAQQVTAAAA